MPMSGEADNHFKVKFFGNQLYNILYNNKHLSLRLPRSCVYIFFISISPLYFAKKILTTEENKSLSQKTQWFTLAFLCASFFVYAVVTFF